MSGILIVEDEAIVAEDIRTTLESFGYEVVGTADSAESAVALADEHSPDLALMDIRLRGELDGVATADILRRRDVSVVYLTAYTDEQTVSRARETGALGYLVKPFDQQELKAAVATALYKHTADIGLRRRERWYSSALSSIGDAIIAVDAQQRITFMNSVAEALIGWSFSDAEGQRVRDLAQLVDERTGTILHEDPIERALAGGLVSEQSRRTLLRDRGGALHAIENSYSPIFAEDRRICGAVMVFRDVRERSRLEQQIARADRLASLGTVASGIGHEINNPLSYVLGNLQALTAHIDARRGEHEQQSTTTGWLDEMAGMISDATAGATRIRDIVADLRVFSSPQESPPRPIDVVSVAKWALRTTTKRIEAQARLRTDLGEAPRVLADESRLGQVLVNILLNAAEACDGAGEAASVVLMTGTTAAGEALIEIRDGGSGIAPEVLPRIFDPFFTTKQVGLGTGLGLFVSHSIVAALGGRLDVESAGPGCGATFRITLPPAVVGEVRDVAPAPRAPVAPRGRVLIIDDEPLLCRAVRRLLRDDFDVEALSDPTTAIRLITSGARFDAIVCDVLMAPLDGQGVYEAVHARDPEQAGRIVFMTGGVFTPRAHEFLESVGNLCLTKPVESDRLRSVLAEMVRQPWN